MEKDEALRLQEPFAPLVTVIIPCYNAEKTLREALDSALSQAKEVPIELILIDDGCTDGTPGIMKRYVDGIAKARAGAAKGNPDDARCDGFEGVTSIRVIRHEKSRGVAAGRNEGVAAAFGKYVAFLDADDRWARGKLKAQLKVMEGNAGADQKKPSLCCTARELMSPEGVLTGRVIPVKEKISYRQLLSHNSINCSSVLIRREIIRRFPMEHEDSHEDYLTWLKVVKHFGPAAGINEPYLKYRLTGAGKSGSKLKSAKMTYAAYRYAGFGRAVSGVLFVRYALHGVWKYMRA